MNDDQECLHEVVFFGSGDFHIMCRDCAAVWNWASEFRRDNVGDATFLSGEVRVKSEREE